MVLKTVFVSCFALIALTVSPVRAQLGASDLPDLSGLAGAIEQSVKTPPPAPPKGTLFRSGLIVPSVHPGAAATDIARQMRVSIEAKTGPNPAMQKLEAAMPGLITGLEAQMQKQGFAKRDLGVATGLFFVGNWETATKHSLSDPAENAVVRAVSTTATSKWKARFSSLSPAAKEKIYESLLAGTALLSVFAQSFDKAGKTQEAAGIRQTAGALFQKVVGAPPSAVKISADGLITRAASAPPADGLKDVPADSSPASKPAASRGAGVKPSQIAGVYAHQINQMGAGGFLYLGFEPLIAFKDGSYSTDFNVPPSEFDAAASRRKHPKEWGRWRFNAAAGGGHYNGSVQHIQVLSSKGIWETSDWIGPLQGGGTGQRLSGTYTHTGGSGNTAYGGDAIAIQQNTYLFSSDGHFRAGRAVGASFNSGTYGSSKATDGTYTLSNYAITLRFGNGTVRRCLYARLEDGMIFLQGDPYTRKDGK